MSYMTEEEWEEKYGKEWTDRQWYLMKSKKVYKFFYFLFMTSFVVLVILSIISKSHINNNDFLYGVLALIMFGISRIFKYKVNDNEYRIENLYKLRFDKRVYDKNSEFH